MICDCCPSALHHAAYQILARAEHGCPADYLAEDIAQLLLDEEPEGGWTLPLASALQGVATVAELRRVLMAERV